MFKEKMDTPPKYIKGVVCNLGHLQIPRNVTLWGTCRLCEYRRRHTRAEDRGEKKKRKVGTRTKRTHCLRGHPLVEGNIKINRSADGKERRACRTCYNARCRESMRRRRAELRAGGRKRKIVRQSVVKIQSAEERRREERARSEKMVSSFRRFMKDFGEDE